MDRSTWWKIRNLWYIPLLFTMFFSPLALLYMGVVVNRKDWVRGAIFLLIGMFVCVFAVGNEKYEGFWVALFLVLWLITIVATIVKSKEYLQLLDRKERKEEPNPITFEPFNPTETSDLGDKFISDLQQWKNEINIEQMQLHIEELIELAKVVKQRNSEDSFRFFSRYSSQINNILHKYDELENARLNCDDIKEAMAKIEQTLEKINLAFRKEVSAMFKSDILTINAETSAFMQDLKNRGLIED